MARLSNKKFNAADGSKITVTFENGKSGEFVIDAITSRSMCPYLEEICDEFDKADDDRGGGNFDVVMFRVPCK